MASKSFVKFQTPSDVQAKVLQLIEAAKASNGLRKGTNEATKAIERGEAKLVVIAEDVDPEEIVMHLPAICTERAIAFLYVASKKDLGLAAGLKVGTAAVAITAASSAESTLKDLSAKYTPGKQEKS
ncbi:MAG: 50S ribosomal protein L7Ae [Candidatus Micrarchaeota archaeon]